jgi:hypothetical protein
MGNGGLCAGKRTFWSSEFTAKSALTEIIQGLMQVITA